MKNEERAKRLEDERRLANETITALKAELAETNGLYAETVSQFQAQTDRCEAAEQALEGIRSVLRQARQFITNGVELGFIRMPTSADDPAHETLPAIEAALNPTPQGGKPALGDETQEDRDRANEESWFFDMDGKP